MLDNINKEYLKELKGKNVLIVGLGKRTGVSLANLLNKLSVKYCISDSKNREKLGAEIEMLDNAKVPIYTGRQTAEQLSGVNLIVLSPGVPPNIPLLRIAAKEGIEIISEIELVYRLIDDAVFIGITGTDGKTTTTSLCSKILESAGSVHTAGNIGNALSGLAERIKPGDRVLLELSSFQLEGVKKFSPHISAVLNIAEDHLDRYENIHDYFLAKKRIYRQQGKDDFLIVNYDNAYTRSLIEEVNNTNILSFSMHNENADMFIEGDTVFLNSEAFISLKGIKLRGAHNRENIMAAALIAHKAGVPAFSIEEAVKFFPGVEHRLEELRTLNGVTYYNDSKATTIHAVEKALDGLDQRLLLIMGGRSKKLDFSKLKGSVHKSAVHLLLIGEAMDEIEQTLNFPNTHKCGSLENAVKKAHELAEHGDAVLLSPACESYDQFKSYVERGEKFKKYVNELK